MDLEQAEARAASAGKPCGECGLRWSHFSLPSPSTGRQGSVLTGCSVYSCRKMMQKTQNCHLSPQVPQAPQHVPQPRRLTGTARRSLGRWSEFGGARRGNYNNNLHVSRAGMC